MAKIIDGKRISAEVKDECKERVKREQLDITLAVIQVGNDPASTVCRQQEKGMRVYRYSFPCL